MTAQTSVKMPVEHYFKKITFLYLPRVLFGICMKVATKSCVWREIRQPDVLTLNNG